MRIRRTNTIAFRMDVDIRARVCEVLDRGVIMTLATVDDGGVWASDVAFVHVNEVIYWMSFEVTRHSRAIVGHPQVAATIRVGEPGEPELALQISGIAEVINGSRPDVAEAYAAKRERKKDELALLGGRQWYALRPNFVDLIDEVHFGYQKQKLFYGG